MLRLNFQVNTFFYQTPMANEQGATDASLYQSGQNGVTQLVGQVASRDRMDRWHFRMGPFFRQTEKNWPWCVWPLFSLPGFTPAPLCNQSEEESQHLTSPIHSLQKCCLTYWATPAIVSINGKVKLRIEQITRTQRVRNFEMCWMHCIDYIGNFAFNIWPKLQML